MCAGGEVKKLAGGSDSAKQRAEVLIRQAEKVKQLQEETPWFVSFFRDGSAQKKLKEKMGLAEEQLSNARDQLNKFKNPQAAIAIVKKALQNFIEAHEAVRDSDRSVIEKGTTVSEITMGAGAILFMLGTAGAGAIAMGGSTIAGAAIYGAAEGGGAAGLGTITIPQMLNFFLASIAGGAMAGFAGGMGNAATHSFATDTPYHYSPREQLQSVMQGGSIGLMQGASPFAASTGLELSRAVPRTVVTLPNNTVVEGTLLVRGAVKLAPIAATNAAIAAGETIIMGGSAKDLAAGAGMAAGMTILNGGIFGTVNTVENLKGARIHLEGHDGIVIYTQEPGGEPVQIASRTWPTQKVLSPATADAESPVLPPPSLSSSTAMVSSARNPESGMAEIRVPRWAENAVNRARTIFSGIASPEKSSGNLSTHSLQLRSADQGQIDLILMKAERVKVDTVALQKALQSQNPFEVLKALAELPNVSILVMLGSTFRTMSHRSSPQYQDFVRELVFQAKEQIAPGNVKATGEEVDALAVRAGLNAQSKSGGARNASLQNRLQAFGCPDPKNLSASLKYLLEHPKYRLSKAGEKHQIVQTYPAYEGLITNLISAIEMKETRGGRENLLAAQLKLDPMLRAHGRSADGRPIRFPKTEAFFKRNGWGNHFDPHSPEQMLDTLVYPDAEWHGNGDRNFDPVGKEGWADAVRELSEAVIPQFLKPPKMGQMGRYWFPFGEIQFPKFSPAAKREVLRLLEGSSEEIEARLTRWKQEEGEETSVKGEDKGTLHLAYHRGVRGGRASDLPEKTAPTSGGGWNWAAIDSLGDGPVGRFYVGVRAAHAEKFWEAFEREVAEPAKEQGIEFQAKQSTSSRRLENAGDSTVVYFKAQDQKFFYDTMVSFVRHHEGEGWFHTLEMDRRPVFTAQVLDPQGKAISGLSFGQNPGRYSSFNGVVSEAVTRALRGERLLDALGVLGDLSDVARVNLRTNLIFWELDRRGVDTENPAFLEGGTKDFPTIYPRTDQGFNRVGKTPAVAVSSPSKPRAHRDTESGVAKIRVPNFSSSSSAPVFRLEGLFPKEGKFVSQGQREIKIGRGDKADFAPLDDSSATRDGVSRSVISRHHATIIYENGKFYVVPIKPNEAEVWVNGKKIMKKKEIKAGDAIRFGHDGTCPEYFFRIPPVTTHRWASGSQKISPPPKPGRDPELGAIVWTKGVASERFLPKPIRALFSSDSTEFLEGISSGVHAERETETRLWNALEKGDFLEALIILAGAPSLSIIVQDGEGMRAKMVTQSHRYHRQLPTAIDELADNAKVQINFDPIQSEEIDRLAEAAKKKPTLAPMPVPLVRQPSPSPQPLPKPAAPATLPSSRTPTGVIAPPSGVDGMKEFAVNGVIGVKSGTMRGDQAAHWIDQLKILAGELDQTQDPKELAGAVDNALAFIRSREDLFEAVAQDGEAMEAYEKLRSFQRGEANIGDANAALAQLSAAKKAGAGIPSHLPPDFAQKLLNETVTDARLKDSLERQWPAEDKNPDGTLKSLSNHNLGALLKDVFGQNLNPAKGGNEIALVCLANLVVVANKARAAGIKVPIQDNFWTETLELTGRGKTQIGFPPPPPTQEGTVSLDHGEERTPAVAEEEQGVRQLDYSGKAEYENDQPLFPQWGSEGYFLNRGLELSNTFASSTQFGKIENNLRQAIDLKRGRGDQSPVRILTIGPGQGNLETDLKNIFGNDIIIDTFSLTSVLTPQTRGAIRKEFIGNLNLHDLPTGYDRIVSINGTNTVEQSRVIKQVVGALAPGGEAVVILGNSPVAGKAMFDYPATREYLLNQGVHLGVVNNFPSPTVVTYIHKDHDVKNLSWPAKLPYGVQLPPYRYQITNGGPYFPYTFEGQGKEDVERVIGERLEVILNELGYDVEASRKEGTFQWMVRTVYQEGVQMGIPIDYRIREHFECYPNTNSFIRFKLSSPH